MNIRKICQDAGGELMSINSFEEYDFILDLLQIAGDYKKQTSPPKYLPLLSLHDVMCSEDQPASEEHVSGNSSVSICVLLVYQIDMDCDIT